MGDSLHTEAAGCAGHLPAECDIHLWALLEGLRRDIVCHCVGDCGLSPVAGIKGMKEFLQVAQG